MDESTPISFHEQASEALALRKQELGRLMTTSENHAQRLFDACLTIDELKMQVRAMALPQEAKAGVVRPNQAGAEVVEKIDLVLAATDLGNKAEALVANLLKDVPAFGGLRERVRAFALAAIAEAKKQASGQDMAVTHTAHVPEAASPELADGLSPEQCKKTVESFRQLFAVLKSQRDTCATLLQQTLSQKDRGLIDQLINVTNTKLDQVTGYAKELMGEQSSVQIEKAPAEAVDAQTIAFMRSNPDRTKYFIAEMTGLIRSNENDLQYVLAQAESDGVKQALKVV